MATLSGEPLYNAYGFRPIERLEDATGSAPGADRADGEADRPEACSGSATDAA